MYINIDSVYNCQSPVLVRAAVLLLKRLNIFLMLKKLFKR